MVSSAPLAASRRLLFVYEGHLKLRWFRAEGFVRVGSADAYILGAKWSLRSYLGGHVVPEGGRTSRAPLGPCEMSSPGLFWSAV